MVIMSVFLLVILSVESLFYNLQKNCQACFNVFFPSCLSVHFFFPLLSVLQVVMYFKTCQ